MYPSHLTHTADVFLPLLPKAPLDLEGQLSQKLRWTTGALQVLNGGGGIPGSTGLAG
jgi:hypothetical protein